MIKVWTDAAESGLLDRHGERGGTFVYLPDTPAARAVSVTMPVRLPSWSVPFGLPPIFEMNLPEGFLRERLRLAFAKATGTFDEFDLLSIVGRSQVGRIRYTGDKEQLHEDVPFQSVVSVAAKKGTSSAVEREPGVGLRSGLRWGAERGKKLTASSLRRDCPRF
jgi:serine/threonine-protein kinase HipA